MSSGHLCRKAEATTEPAGETLSAARLTDEVLILKLHLYFHLPPHPPRLRFGTSLYTREALKTGVGNAHQPWLPLEGRGCPVDTSAKQKHRPSWQARPRILGVPKNVEKRRFAGLPNSVVPLLYPSPSNPYKINDLFLRLYFGIEFFIPILIFI